MLFATFKFEKVLIGDANILVVRYTRNHANVNVGRIFVVLVICVVSRVDLHEPRDVFMQDMLLLPCASTRLYY